MKVRYARTGWIAAALVAVACWSGPARAQTAPAGPPKTYTNKTYFHLPIEIDDRARSLLQEVVLYVKAGGGSWEKAHVAPPTQKFFEYRVTRDDEYWFNVVTVDRQGRSNPADVTREAPALMVVVDTAPPAVEVKHNKLLDGEAAVRCTLSDANPDYQKVQIAFLGTDQGWHDLPGVPGLPGVFRVPPQPVLNGTFRCTATDKAGNTHSQIVSLDLGTPAGPAAPVPPPQQVAQQTAVPAPELPPVEARSSLRPNLPAETPPNPAPPLRQTAAAVDVGAGVGLNQTRFPAPETNVSVNQANFPAPAETPALPPQLPPVQNVAQPAPVTNATPPAPVPAGQPAGQPGERQLVNTRRAAIEYRLDKVGPSGVSKVDVWVMGERPAGWQRLATDRDSRSPVEVDLPGDGTYGIRLAVTNGNGFGGNPPLPNDTPDFWLEVDTTPPFAQLRNIDTVAAGGLLEIRWTASDKNLGAEPIALYYAVQPNGPWVPIARNLKNEGHHAWQFPRNVGSQFFLRLEVRDEAGNVAQIDTPSPILLDLTEPRALVVGVTGAAGTAAPR